MNEFLKALKNSNNYGLTENGGIKHNTTFNAVLDMFAMGGAMRNRCYEDIIEMFSNAYKENHTLALRCLFYLRDVRGGQGERRFFRTCIKWLATEYPEEMGHLIPLVAEYGRYDDLFELFGTPCEKAMMSYIYNVIYDNKDHLIYKWMPSINTSSLRTQELGRKFARDCFHLSERDYRRLLSHGRKACHLVESLMSQNHWDQIAFDKLPSRAGLLYKNAFQRREETRERYEAFMASKETKVNAGTLNPVDIAHRILYTSYGAKTEREALQKYWDALPDYYEGREEPGIAVVDTSGSMYGQPLEAAISLGAYIAERGKGPFKDHFITFSAYPELVQFSGVDIYEKFRRAENADWGGNTDIEAVFDLILKQAFNNHVPAKEMPKTLYIFSDMEFDMAVSDSDEVNTVIEAQVKKWSYYGYEVPRIIFWNLDARTQNIPAMGGKFSYVSGFSPVMISTILGGKDGWDLCLEKLNSERYQAINSIQ